MEKQKVFPALPILHTQTPATDRLGQPLDVVEYAAVNTVNDRIRPQVPAIRRPQYEVA
jgi:hypothetical protein